MRNYLVKTCLLTMISFVSIGQAMNTNTGIKNFIKVWGFLKYYHPKVAKSTADWDSVFVNNVQKIGDARSTDQFNRQVLDIINLIEKPPKVESYKTTDSLFVLNKADDKWIRNSIVFGKKLKDQLEYIYQNKNQDSNRYIRMNYETTNFSGEKKYDSLGFPDTAYRLLFLARFWNIINYYAPYKYLTTNWDDVLQAFIPKIESASNSLAWYKTLQELCKTLHDGHSQVIMPGGFSATDTIFGGRTVPFYCDIVEGKVVVRDVFSDSIGKALNIQRGDIILAMDDVDMKQVINNKRKYISASNETDEMHQLSSYILDGEKTAVKLTIQRQNKVNTATVIRIPLMPRNWEKFINYTGNNTGYERLTDSVLLVYAGGIWSGNIDTIRYLIKQSKAVIFDVRNYPMDDAFYSITDPFQSEPRTINYSTVALPANPGVFKWFLNPNQVGHFSDSACKGKVIILCDERTQSQGEYSCMVLQTIPQAVTIGSQTAGADGVNREVPVGGGITISYSCYGVYYPDKTQTQRTGIRIDIPVKKTAAAVREGKDEIMDRALRFIKDGK